MTRSVMLHPIRITALPAAIILLVGLSGCGHKTRLTPPEPLRLATITGIQADMTCNTISLQWEPVLFDSRGNVLDAPAAYLILRRRGGLTESTEKTGKTTSTPPSTSTQHAHDSDIPPTDPAPDTPLTVPTGADQVMTPEIDSEPGQGSGSSRHPDILPTEYEYSIIAWVEGIPVTPSDPDWAKARITWEDPGIVSGPIWVPGDRKIRKPRMIPDADTDRGPDILVPGYNYYYMIVAVSADGVTSEPSTPIRIPWMHVPGPPRNVTGEVGQNRVTLRWAAPETNCRGLPLAQWDFAEIHRSTGDSMRYTMVARVEATQPAEYRDDSVAIDTVYRYRIRVMVLPGDVPGEYSEAVEVVTTDVFPPPAPMDLTGAAVSGDVYLNWRHVAGSDLAGYHVYRRTGTSTAFIRLTPDGPVSSNTFIDSSVQPGEHYGYAVTSVDSSPRFNESDQSDEWTISVR
ncbi:hypothetical protein JXA80_04355 [bacterium]|nr:hypothetical protein [candidate division CSSED10-310 bacterium]